ncbi:transcriptional regulator, LysR family [Gemmobacter megaterium]|uniref:Transcriptional regulator, LysR family n=1 Tax=Gemmobacter megaterium TaxID=1086013 RepID=A0A1N7M5P5_9RHOB|nr:LysR substrate-binding domain-containing protein [Gemmobacter megaterium]GGE08748.1 LysR family transcriptional regulator [Gemmobacter megaterium]SIS81410.1 transcriptional regulator, LysR family [Gemmobacter megaterium]
MRITHRQLEAFIQFMETGTVTAAADRMLVTQPAMSKMLAGLEIDLKLALFQREKRRLIPTDEARLLYNEVRRLFASLSDVERFADDLRTFRTGELRIISSSTLGLTLVADALSDFCKENPEVDVLMDMSSNVGPDVLAANADIGFSVTQFQHPSLKIEPLFHVSSVCVVHKDHPLAARQRLGPKDLEGEEFISFTRNTRMRHITDGVFEQYRVARKMRIEVFASAEANALVSRGVGVAIVEPLGVRQNFWPDIVAIPFDPPIEFTFSAFRPRDRIASPLTNRYMEILQRYVRQMRTGESHLPHWMEVRLPGEARPATG